eukprot:COSAG01_NODE_95_length_26957_cov_48.328617_34_plen_93_part_00
MMVSARISAMAAHYIASVAAMPVSRERSNGVIACVITAYYVVGGGRRRAIARGGGRGQRQSGAPSRPRRRLAMHGCMHGSCVHAYTEWRPRS